jgi:hypothetical protein
MAIAAMLPAVAISRINRFFIDLDSVYQGLMLYSGSTLVLLPAFAFLGETRKPT